MDRRLQTYVTATLLTAAAGQLASTADAVTVGQFVDIDAVSVLSLIMPVTVVISCMGLLLGFGANALSARAIGQHNERATIRIFSTAMLSLTVVGLFLSLLLWREAPVVASLLTNEDEMRMLATDYLSVYALGTWLEMVSYGLCLFVATDGYPLRVSVAIAIGVVANVIADILLIGFLDMGMKGAALGSILQFAITTLLLAVHLRFSDSHFRFQWPVAGFKYHLLTNIKEGTPITLSSLLMAVILLLINSITYHTLGADGLFFWSANAFDHLRLHQRNDRGPLCHRRGDDGQRASARSERPVPSVVAYLMRYDCSANGHHGRSRCRRHRLWRGRRAHAVGSHSCAPYLLAYADSLYSLVPPCSLLPDPRVRDFECLHARVSTPLDAVRFMGGITLGCQPPLVGFPTFQHPLFTWTSSFFKTEI